MTVINTTTKEVARFLSHTTVTEHGLIWTGSVNVVTRYPQFRIRREGKSFTVLAHRWFYQQTKGEIPQGHDVHHKCHLRRCLTCLETKPAVENRREQMRANKARRFRIASERMVYRGLNV